MPSSAPAEMTSTASVTPETPETLNPSDTSAAATPARATYQVTGVPQGDYLNVRAGAGADSEVVTKLDPGAGGILLGTKRVTSGATTWQEVTVNGQSGWVNAAYIALEHQMPASPPESPTSPSDQ